VVFAATNMFGHPPTGLQPNRVSAPVSSFLQTHSVYGVYFKMKSMGVSLPAIRQKMELDGLGKYTDILQYSKHDTEDTIAPNLLFVSTEVDDSTSPSTAHLNHHKRTISECMNSTITLRTITHESTVSKQSRPPAASKQPVGFGVSLEEVETALHGFKKTRIAPNYGNRKPCVQ
jgi:hypothetical protein